MMMTKYYMINGRLTPAQDASINVTDLGLLRGYGIFDFFVCDQGIPVFFEDHVNRLRNSVQFLGMEVPYSDEAIYQQIVQLTKANGFEKAGLKIIFTGGYSEDGYNPTAPNMIMIQNQFKLAPSHYFTDGIKLVTHDYIREIPDVKTLNYLVPISIRNKLADTKAQDVLYFKDGIVSESSRSNIFIVDQENTVITNEFGVLWGITRKQILNIAKAHYKVEERVISLEDVMNAKEVFLTSSTKGTMGVTKIDDTRIADGKVGKITLHLGELLKQLKEEYILEKKKSA